MSTAVTDRAAVADVDPRIQARRDEVARARQRRRRRGVFVVLVVVSLVTAGWLVTRSALFDVDEITVTGAVRTDLEDLRRATGVALGSPLLDVDADDVRRKVRELPWIADATVRVHWRGTVEVVVSERDPLAVLVDGSNDQLVVDREGRVVALDDPRGIDAVVVVEGLVAAALGEHVEDPHGALAVAAALPPEVRANVHRVVVTEAGTIDLALDSGAVAWLGRFPDLMVTLRDLETALDQIDPRGVRVYDLRVPGQVVVVRDEPDDAGTTVAPHG